MFSKETDKKIKAIIKRFMDGVIQRKVYDDPWDYEKEKEKKPFHLALVPEAIWKGSKFERSFVTSLGMIGWEQMAKVLAEEHHGYAENSYTVEGKMLDKQMHKIQSILNDLEKSREPNGIEEINQINAIDSGDMIDVRVTSDLYIYNDSTDTHYYIEIKSPKPNSDQTKVSKEKIFKIKAIYPEDNHKAYFALPFNPYISREDYGHSHPKRWFKMTTSPLVKMGKGFWDLVGGEGAYENLMDIAEEVGEQYRNTIEKEYLNL